MLCKIILPTSCQKVLSFDRDQLERKSIKKDLDTRKLTKWNLWVHFIIRLFLYDLIERGIAHVYSEKVISRYSKSKLQIRSIYNISNVSTQTYYQLTGLSKWERRDFRNKVLQLYFKHYLEQITSRSLPSIFKHVIFRQKNFF